MRLAFELLPCRTTYDTVCVLGSPKLPACLRVSPVRVEQPDGHITGEASPGYMVYSEVPERIKSQLPAVQILAVVRDPVTRAFSSYKYNYLRNLQPGALPIPFGVMVRRLS